MHKNDETKLEFLSIPNFVSYVLNKEMKAWNPLKKSKQLKMS
jgi:hypothetical protein